ncbi:hypothetical protein IWW36_005295 [Coemansia brasiliensis]|uniref:Uncharacterized protein n=1 Tax=Coemansia brasiliensis TaxID=2650707 RepID=A0A9W8I1W0_9FUNG|nr:hypothetical protein IWW36_005295 [Coemansia brasiliensis]
MTRPPSSILSSAVAEEAARYLEFTKESSAWETSIAQQILQAFSTLASALGNIQTSAHKLSFLDQCQNEWTKVEASIATLLHEIQSSDLADDTANNRDSAECTLCFSRQAIKSLREYIKLLAICAGQSDEKTLQAVTEALYTAGLKVAQIYENLCAEESLPVDANSEHQQQPETTSSKQQQIMQEALASASTLAEMLRSFTRMARQSLSAVRSQMAHVPNVPSPLSSGGSLLQHRRWVSEEIDGESNSSGDLKSSTDNKAKAMHMRNRSDSRIQPPSSQRSPLMRKSALLQQKSSQPAINAEPGERAKQVRFHTSLHGGEAAVDQARLNELVQLLAQLDTAIATLREHADYQSSSDSNKRSCTQAVKGLATAFVQISRLSSTSGLVKHYDKATLAQFKITTQSVKLLMAQQSS